MGRRLSLHRGASLGAPPAKATRVEGGYRISGSWSWASGIMDADWIVASAMLPQNRGENRKAAGTRLLVRAQDAKEARADMDGTDLFTLVGALSWVADQPALASRSDHIFGIVAGAILAAPAAPKRAKTDEPTGYTDQLVAARFTPGRRRRWPQSL
jgi:hypothetical protein